jgi:hypothetical protein
MSEKEVLIRELYKYGSTFLFWYHKQFIMLQLWRSQRI